MENETSITVQLAQAAAALDEQRDQIRLTKEGADPDEAKHLSEALANVRHAKLHLNIAANALGQAAKRAGRNL